MKTIKHILMGAAILTAQTQLTFADTDTSERLERSAEVLRDVLKADDKSIPDDLIGKAHCAVIVPSLKKGAFIVGAKYGRGFMTCRQPGTAWGAPAAIKIEGGGVGFQIGAAETELVLLVMNEHGAERLMSSQFTLGGEGDIAAGPVGRNASAQTDAKFTAEILSWSRSRGAFAGISLQGATLREDEDENKELYGRKLSTKEVIQGKLAIPASAQPLIRALARQSPKEDQK